MPKLQRTITKFTLTVFSLLFVGIAVSWLILGSGLGPWLGKKLPVLVLYVVLFSITFSFTGIWMLRFYPGIRNFGEDEKEKKEDKNILKLFGGLFVLLIIFSDSPEITRLLKNAPNFLPLQGDYLPL